jgi:CMP-N,N'-diacetyllegionaminic acid synthase
MVIYIDIDDTICNSPNKPDYTNSTPILENIEKANKLYDQGNTIIYWTARGTVSGIDWKDITLNQFKTWGVKYHDIKFGKPYYDLFIDDKNINTKDWI